MLGPARGHAPTCPRGLHICRRHTFPAVAGGHSLLPPQTETQPCLGAACPPPQHPGFPSPGLLQLTSSSRRKQACRLWCLSTNLSPTSLCAGPRRLRCVASFFPMAAAAGLRPDVGITRFGSGLRHYSQGCQHTPPLPSFSDAKVFSLIDAVFLGDLLRLMLSPRQGFPVPSPRPISSRFEKNAGPLLCS